MANERDRWYGDFVITETECRAELADMKEDMNTMNTFGMQPSLMPI